MKDTVKLYYRLAKPGIVYGNLLSAFAGFFLASRGAIDFALLAATITGTGLVIGSGCVFNNYLDRKIDKKMERTKRRALADGKISTASALLYGSVLGLAGFSTLWLFTTLAAVLAGLAGIIFYVIVYGYAKRRTHWGTVIGSIPGATPPVGGYVAVTGSFDEAALLLFLILVIWQMPHFYAISIFRLKDYQAAGLPVLAAVRGVETTKIRIMAYIVAFTLIAPLLTVFDYTGLTYAAVVALLGIAWFWKGLQGYRTSDNAAWARRMFGFSLLVLLGWTLITSVDILLP